MSTMWNDLTAENIRDVLAQGHASEYAASPLGRYLTYVLDAVDAVDSADDDPAEILEAAAEAFRELSYAHGPITDQIRRAAPVIGHALYLAVSFYLTATFEPEHVPEGATLSFRRAVTGALDAEAEDIASARVEPEHSPATPEERAAALRVLGMAAPA